MYCCHQTYQNTSGIKQFESGRYHHIWIISFIFQHLIPKYSHLKWLYKAASIAVLHKIRLGHVDGSMGQQKWLSCCTSLIKSHLHWGPVIIGCSCNVKCARGVYILTNIWCHEKCLLGCTWLINSLLITLRACNSGGNSVLVVLSKGQASLMHFYLHERARFLDGCVRKFRTRGRVQEVNRRWISHICR